MVRRVALLWTVLAIAGTSLLGAADEGELKTLLSGEIIGPVLPLAEVQRYCEARVPRMPKIRSVAEWQKEAARLLGLKPTTLNEKIKRLRAQGPSGRPSRRRPNGDRAAAD